tara:strand:+ start:271 stop:564 length:294 start_codon:yes stop_codon:yes gene_type:complete
MKFDKVSDFEKYIVLSDKSNGKLGWTWDRFLNFKRVMEIMHRIAFSDKSTYSNDGTIYSRKISSSLAKQAVTNVSDAKWNDKTSSVLIIANQIGLKI